VLRGGTPHGAAHTRIVSVAGICCDARNLSDLSKG
jgi:hypothetical protein